MRRSLALFFIAALCAAQDLGGRADRYVDYWFKAGKFMGSVLVARNGETVFRKSYGWANAEWEVPNVPEAKYRLGSITKQFTAVAILQLVEQGKLKLDDPINKYLPNPPASWEAVTIEHLLTHTSGIPSYTGLPGFFEKRISAPLTPIEIADLSRDLPLEFKPGEKFAYNNTGYVLLGYIVNKVTGVPYIDYLRAHVLDPAGMKDTGYDSFSEVIPRRATGYSGSVANLRNSRYIDMSLPYSAGALYSTVEDLRKWDQVLYTNKLLTPESMKRMFTPGKDNYGFGWFIDKLGTHPRIGHGGGIPGFNSMIARYPEEKLLVVVLSNLETDATEKIAAGLAHLAFGETAELPGGSK
jgi:D-alanyl-D-alanine carboxypeptidase